MDILEEDLGEFTKTITEDTTEVVKKQLEAPQGISSLFGLVETPTSTTTSSSSDKPTTRSSKTKENEAAKSGSVFLLFSSYPLVLMSIMLIMVLPRPLGKRALNHACLHYKVTMQPTSLNHRMMTSRTNNFAPNSIPKHEERK